MLTRNSRLFGDEIEFDIPLDIFFFFFYTMDTNDESCLKSNADTRYVLYTDLIYIIKEKKEILEVFLKIDETC